MAITGNADVGATIEQVVSTLTTQTLIQESIALGAVRDFSALVGPGMDQLDIPLFNELSVQDVSEVGAEMTAQTISPVAASLLLDKHKAVPFSITSSARIESKLALVEEAVFNGGRSLAANIDDLIFGEVVSAAKTTETVAGTDALEEILRMKEQFDLDNVPRSMRYLVASPVWCRRLLGTNNIIRADEYGSSDAIQNGLVTKIYGFNILESSSSALPADGFVGMHMEGIAFARQRAVTFEQERRVLAQKDDYVLVHKFGLKSTAVMNPRLYVFDPA